MNGGAAADSDGVLPGTKQLALEALQKTARLFGKGFRDLGQCPALAKAKPHIFVRAWQGALVVARSGEGPKHIDRAFRSLKGITLISEECKGGKACAGSCDEYD